MNADAFTAALRAIETAAPEDFPAVSSALAALQAAFAARLVSAPPPAAIASPAPGTPRLLSVKEAAVKLGVSRWWILRHRDELPRVITQKAQAADKRKGLRERRERYAFSERSLERWMRDRETR